MQQQVDDKKATQIERLRLRAEHRQKAFTRCAREDIKTTMFWSSSGAIEEIRCKICGARIMGFVEDERFEESRLVNGQMVMYKKLVPAYLPGFAQIRLIFDDNSAHITHMCSACVAELNEEKLELIYASDMKIWMQEEDQGKGAAPWEVLATRKPVRFEVI